VERSGYVTREVRDALVGVLGPESAELIAVWPLTLPDTPVYRARVRRGESGRQVARRAGVSKDAYARAEHGKPVSPSNARKIARALELDDTDLVRLVRPKDQAA
jgi:DNA-binding XRE family transcriptional regulator